MNSYRQALPVQTVSTPQTFVMQGANGPITINSPSVTYSLPLEYVADNSEKTQLLLNFYELLRGRYDSWAVEMKTRIAKQVGISE